ncbi:hypothetical protein NSK11_contig00071-0044 [Nocardia seriolae]|uniref:Uncharacterized protein n=1 Tax=Nocardia seriolae TaxID=37332 RepID=A0ABC9YY88_9NOCA|nr:hypothetical protein NSERKGN1266_60050 [Nocardia seriolae]BEK94110.1 hypothetical protein NSER024013_20160 [Nocardia seriolae]GAM48161.1 hypothetical protein NS07_v2contig00066-0043 [Nocardia seriolae]GAP30071.1 hypothetical protein NSK11_contig00071-0044 [Nocardia seriolae]GEM25531.1 hypothetical protein NS2_37700 [Nocardia seriolae NBRC 15557]
MVLVCAPVSELGTDGLVGRAARLFDQRDQGGYNLLGIGTTRTVGHCPAVDFAIGTDADRHRAIGRCGNGNLLRQHGLNRVDRLARHSRRTTGRRFPTAPHAPQIRTPVCG